MGKSYKKSSKSKRNITLSPKGASEIFRQETVDSKGNKHTLIIDIKPHPITTPTIEGFIKYD